MITKPTKNQKPISLDVHLKYRCPNNNCGYEHWLSLLETQTKNFKIVCDCGMVFKPKKIKTLKIIYDDNLLKPDDSSKPLEKPEIKSPDQPKPNESLLNKAIPCLVDLGFTKQEAIDALTSTYIKQPTQDISVWIKNTLLEIRNNG
jgi:hypothetical protein